MATPIEETTLDLPVRVNVQISAQVNGVDVTGGRYKLMPSTLAADADAMPGELYVIGNELRMRALDGETSVIVASV